MQKRVEREFLIITLASIGTYDGHKGRATDHGNCKDAGRVYGMRAEDEALGYGDHPLAQMSGVTSCRHAV